MKKLLSLILVLLLCLSVFAACSPETPDGEKESETTGSAASDVESAKAYLKSMYTDYLSNNVTASDFKLVSQLKVGDVTYTIKWTTNNESITVVESDETNEVTIDVPEKTSEQIEYVLTATISAPDGKTATLEFKLVVPKYAVLSFEEYMAAESGETVVVEGIVVAMNAKSLGNSRNHLFLADANVVGGYYIYQMDADPVEAGIKIGMTVSVSGPVSPYSGMQEIKGGVATIVDETIKTVEPVDITEKFAAGESLKNYVGLPVTVKGVTIGLQELETASSQYLYFELNGKKSYVRTYVTDFPTTLTIVTDEKGAASSPDKTTIDEAHAAKFDWTANVTGILVLYNNNPYLIPMSVDCFEYLEYVEKTDAQKIDTEINGITIDTEVTINKVIDLPLSGSSYKDVTISWTSDNECAVIDPETGKLTITLKKEAQTVTLTAVFTLGEATKTVTYTIEVAAMPSTVPAVVETPEADTPYKFYIAQATAGKLLYLDGGVDGRYLTMTADFNEAIDVYLEAVEGGYKIYTLVEDAKQYIVVYANDEDKISVKYDANGTSVYTYNAETFAWETTLDDTAYYLGTYNTYETVSASKTSFISAENTRKAQFPLELVTLIDLADCKHTYSGDCDAVCNICTTERTVEADHTWSNACDAECDVCGATRTPSEHKYTNACDKDCDVCGETRTTEDHKDTDENKLCDICDANLALKLNIISEPAADTKYMGYIAQATAGKTLYLDGGVSGRYLTMTSDSTEAVDVYAEAVTGGYKFYILVENTKQYITVYLNDEDKISVKYDANGTSVYTYNAETFAWETTLDDESYYIGTYNNFETVSVSKSSFINAQNTRVSQFPFELITMTCTHAYASDCDATCEFCGAPRTVTNPVHTYSANCDVDCDKCGATRTDVTHNDEDGNFECDVCDAIVEPATDSTLTVEQAATLGALFANDSTGKYTSGKYYVVATIKSLTSPTNYGNMVVVDEDGNELAIYGTYGDKELTTKYGSITGDKPVVGDTVKLYGEIGAFKTSVQMNKGWIVEFTAHTHDWADATCEEPKTCTICGGTEGEANGHTDENDDNVCDVESCQAALTVYVPSKVTTPVAGTAYKMAMYQNNLGSVRYFNGQTGSSAWYLATTDKIKAAVDVYLEAVEGVDGAFRLYFMSGENKTYIRFYERTDSETAGSGSGSLELTTNVPTEYYTYDATLKTLVYTPDAVNSYYLGTYNSYDTFSCSNTSKITESNLGVSQFPLTLVTAVDTTTVADTEKVSTVKTELSVPAEVTDDTTIDLVSTGMYYKDVTVTWTVNTEAKTGSVDVVLGAEAQTLTFVATITKGEASDTATFTVAVSALPSYTATKVTTPAVDTEYYLWMDQNNSGVDKELLFDGTVSSYKLNTTANLSNAVKVKLEAVDGVDGGYRLYFMSGSNKKYIRVYEYNDSGSVNTTSSAPSEYFTFDATLGTLVYTTEGGNTYYLGAYSNKTVMGASNTSYVTGSNAGNVGTSQFVAYLVTVVTE